MKTSLYADSTGQVHAPPEKRFLIRIFLAYFLSLCACAPLAYGAQRQPCVAVIAPVTNSTLMTAADMVTVSLVGTKGISTVDRAEVGRILREQAMSAREGGDLQLGRMLKADLLVVLKWNQRRETVETRVLETRYGALVQCGIQAFKEGALEELADEVAASAVRAAPKAHIDPDKCVIVSIANVWNTTGFAELIRIEEEFPDLLAACLSAADGVLVMDRRQMTALMTERELSGDRAAMRRSAVIVQGEMGIPAGAVFDKHTRPIELRVLLLDAGMQEVCRITERGTVDKLDELAARASKSVLDKVRDLKIANVEASTGEAELFLNVARGRGAVWAADTAVALSPTNQAAQKELIKTILSGNMLLEPFVKYTPSEYVARAEQVARAADICIGAGAPFEMTKQFLHIGLRPTTFAGNFLLEEPAMFLPPEARDYLLMARRLSRMAYEHNPDYYLVDCSRQIHACFETMLERDQYYVNEIENCLCSTNEPYRAKMNRAIKMYSAAALPQWALLRLARRQEPEVRFRARYDLMPFVSSNYAEQANLALDEFIRISEKAPEEVVSNTSYYIRPDEVKSVSFYLAATSQLLKLCPSRRAQIKGVFRAALLANPDAALDMDVLVEILEPDGALTFIERQIEKLSSDEAGVRDKKARSKRLKELSEMKGTLQEAFFPDTRRDGALCKLLLDMNSEEMKKLLAGPLREWLGYRGRWDFVPQHALVEGDRLWINFTCLSDKPRESGDKSFDHLALAEMDLKTGALRSFRIYSEEYVARQLWAPVGWSLTPIVRFRNYLCFGKQGSGIVMFPETPTGGPFDNDGVFFGVESGLPSLIITALAAAGDYLYVGAHTMLYRVRVDDGSSEVLFNTSEQMSDFSMLAAQKAKSPVAPVKTGPFHLEVRGIAVSSDQLKISVILDNEIWRYDTAEESWSKTSIPFGAWNQRNTAERGKHVLMLGADLNNSFWGITMGEMDPDSGLWTMHDLSDAEAEGISSIPAMPLFHRPYKSVRWSSRSIYSIKGITDYGTGVIAVINKYGAWQIVFSPGPGTAPDSIGLAWAETAELRDGVAVRSDSEPPASEPDDLPDLQGLSPEKTRFYPKRVLGLMSARSQDGKLLNTLLCRHAALGSVKTLLPLLDAGADPNAVRIARRCTPLIMALAYGKEDEALLLLDRGANPNTTDETRTPPLAYALLACMPRAVKALVDRGANVRALNKYGYNMLAFAAAGGNVDCMKLLLDCGLDVNHRESNWGRGTPLHTAVEWGNIDAIRFLVERGADINALANRYVYNNLNPLFFADSAGAARCLIELGCDMSWKSKGGRSLTEFHCGYNNGHTLNELLLAGIPVTPEETKALREVLLNYHTSLPWIRRAVEEAVARGQLILPDD